MGKQRGGMSGDRPCAKHHGPRDSRVDLTLKEFIKMQQIMQGDAMIEVSSEITQPLTTVKLNIPAWQHFLRTYRRVLPTNINAYKAVALCCRCQGNKKDHFL